MHVKEKTLFFGRVLYNKNNVTRQIDILFLDFLYHFYIGVLIRVNEILHFSVALSTIKNNVTRRIDIVLMEFLYLSTTHSTIQNFTLPL